MNQQEETAYHLDVNLKEALGKEVFNETYQIPLSKDFVENSNPKDHGFVTHVHGFVQMLKQNSVPVKKQTTYKKWDIYVVSYGMNTGSEVNGNRPAIIYKATHSTL